MISNLLHTLLTIHSVVTRSLPNNLDSIEWLDIGENEESLLELSFLESSLIHDAQGFTEGPVWVSDTSYALEGYFLFTKELEGCVQKLVFNASSGTYQSELQLDLASIGYRMPCGMAHNPRCSIPGRSDSILAIAVFDAEGAVITYSLDQRKILHIYNELIMFDDSGQRIQRNFGSLNDIAMDSECNVYFTEMTVMDSPQPGGFDGVYAINLKSHEMKIIDSSIHGANGLVLSPKEDRLFIGNCKWKNTLSNDDFFDIFGKKTFDNDVNYYNQLYWKRYSRQVSDADAAFETQNGADEVFVNASLYWSRNERIRKLSLNTGLDANDFRLFSPGISDGMLQDELGNFWFIHNGNDGFSHIFVANLDGVIFGLVRKKIADPEVPGTFSNMVLAEAGKALYVTGGVFEFGGDPKGWVLKIPLRARGGTQDIGHWLDSDIVEFVGDDRVARVKNEAVETCAQSFARIGSCRIESFLSANVLNSMLGEFGNASKTRFNDTTTVFVSRPKDLVNFEATHPRNHESHFSYVFVDKFEFGLRSAVVSLYYQEWFVNLLKRIFGVESLYRSHDYNRSVFGTHNVKGDFAGWHFDEHPYSCLIMLQAPEKGGSFDYYHNIRITGDEEKTYDNLGKIFDMQDDGVNGDVCVSANAAQDVCEDNLKYVEIEPKSNTMYLFKGNVSVHRVSEIVGDTARIVAGYVWSDQFFFKHSNYFKETVFDKEQNL